jgi:hypothetical protein
MVLRGLCRILLKYQLIYVACPSIARTCHIIITT